MENLFSTVLRMSATGALVILAVLLARLALRRAPRVFSYALWAVVLFRLLCPLTIESAFGLLPSARVVNVPNPEQGVSQVIQVDTGISAVDRSVKGFFIQHPYQGQPILSKEDVYVPPSEPTSARPIQQTGPVPDWRTAPAIVWLAGVSLLLAYSLASLLRLRRRLVGWVPLEGEKSVRLADHIPSPFVLGVFGPKIYLPSGLRSEERDYILLHERTHIRRFDHIFRALAWLALAVHWFNPLVWLAFHLAGKDMEMSCDEAVLRGMGRDIRADYSSSLLRLSVGERLPAGPLAFGSGDPQGRIKNVLNYKKPALWVVVAALIAVVCAGAALATNRTVDAPDPDSSAFDPNSVAADLSLTLDQLEDGVPFVRINGTADGITLDHTIWDPPEWFTQYGSDYAVQYPLGKLWFEVPLCGNEVICALDACWTDESRSAVKVTATPRALISGYSIAGNLIFTVNLSKDSGTLAGLEGYVPKLSADAPELVPTEDEAVRVGLIAARLLTAAEDFYDENMAALAEKQGSDLAFSLDAHGSYVCLSGSVYGLPVSSGTSWSPGSAFDVDVLGQLFIPYPPFGGEDGMVYAWWENEDRTAVTITGQPLALSSSGADYTGWLTFTIALGNDGSAAYQSSYVKGTEENVYLASLSEEEMIAFGRYAAKLLTAAEDYYKQHQPPVSQAPAPEPVSLDGLTFSDGWNNSVSLGGLDCGQLYWYGPGRYYSQGQLFFSGPAFLGSFFEPRPLLSGSACWEDSRHTSMRVDWGGDDQPYGGFLVELATGRVKREGVTGELSDAELAAIAQTLDRLMRAAEDYRTDPASHPAEQGPLPFDHAVEMEFCSGTGGWQTYLRLHPDGSFEGEYSDMDMGGSGPGYQSTEYVCRFHGRFGSIRQVTGASYFMTLEELVIDTGHPIGEQWIESTPYSDGTFYRLRCISSAPYGMSTRDGEDNSIPLEPGAPFMLYTPDASGKRGGELHGMENESSDLFEFWTWWPNRYAISGGSGGTLGCYGLHNMTAGYGFFS